VVASFWAVSSQEMVVRSHPAVKGSQRFEVSESIRNQIKLEQRCTSHLSELVSPLKPQLSRIDKYPEVSRKDHKFELSYLLPHRQ
jgi:hypothetical protein